MMKNLSKSLLLLTAIAVNLPSIQSANILAYFGIAGHSHVNSFWPVVNRLTEQGHNVTLLTTFLPKNTNTKVTVVYSQEMYNVVKDVWDEGGDLVQARLENNHLAVWDAVTYLSIASCQALFQSPAAQNVLHNSKFDLVIFDSAFNDCGIGLAVYKYKCPFVIYAAIPVFGKNYDEYGIPVEASSIPDIEMGYGSPMSYYEKAISVWHPIKWMYRMRDIYYPALNEIFKANLNLKENPDLYADTAKASLVLMNTYSPMDYPRALPPLFVQIAGLHIAPKTNPLPKDLETFVTKPGSDGFMYVSFGTAVQISKVNLELRQRLFSTFGNISNIQFIWKWEGDLPAMGTYPSNILFGTWFPQQDLLAHKRIKGFIGHGGNNGIVEGVHYGVPMLMFPIFADQDFNANALKSKDLAIVKEINGFTQEDIEASIQRILTDKEFLGRVTEASRIFKDRPAKPLDTAVWWIEYVLRHKNTSYLMPLTAKQSWFEARQLDVWFVVFSAIWVAIMVVSNVLYKIFSFFFKTKNPGTSETNGSLKHKMH